MKRVLVTGATGQIGREVVSQLRGTDCHIRAMSRNPHGAALPADVDIVHGDLFAPETLDACLDGIDSVFLVWIGPLTAAAPALDRIAAHARQVVLLTSPHRTPHPFFQQPNGMRVIQAGVEKLIEASGCAGRSSAPDRSRSTVATGGRRRSGTATSCAGSMPTPRARRCTSTISRRSRFERCARRGMTAMSTCSQDLRR